MDNNDEYSNEYRYQLEYLRNNGIDNINIPTNEGEKSLAEVLMYYGVEYYFDIDPGQYGRKDY